VSGEGSEHDRSARDHSNNARTSSTSSSSGSSPSDSDSDALMVSQELQPGFSEDRDVRGGGGGGHSLEDSKNDGNAVACSEVDQQFAADSNGPVGTSTK